MLSLVAARWGGQGHGEAGAQIRWSKDRATGGPGRRGRGRLCQPQGAGSSVRVTLHIWVPSSGPWPRAGLPALRNDKQEPLSGKGGEVAAWVRAPRAVRALPPANLRQSHSDWGDGRARLSWQECSWRDQATTGLNWASSSIWGLRRGVGNGNKGGMMRRRGGATTPSVALGTPAPQVRVGFGTHVGTQDSRVPDKVPCCFLLSAGEKGERRVGSKGPERDSTKLVRQAGTPGGEAWWCPCSRHSALPGL